MMPAEPYFVLRIATHYFLVLLTHFNTSYDNDKSLIKVSASMGKGLVDKYISALKKDEEEKNKVKYLDNN